MLDYHQPQATQFMGAKAESFGTIDGSKPEFGGLIPAFNVNMRWLIAFQTIKEEPITTHTKYSRHRSSQLRKGKVRKLVSERGRGGSPA
jgi:hypothetical protein